MPNVVAAREEVGKAVAFLVNRFGHESDVFRHLTAALAYLKDDPPPKAPSIENDRANETSGNAASEEPNSSAAVSDAAPVIPATPASPASSTRRTPTRGGSPRNPRERPR